MLEILHYEIIRNAIIIGVLASIACGIIGVYVVVKRIVFISGGIAHASFGGIGLGYYLGIDPILGVLPFSIVSALSMGLVSRRSKLPEDTAIGILWAMGMAIGIILVNLTPGYAPDLMTYLFGSILFVSNSDIILMLILDAVIILIVLVFYKEFMALCFDEEFAEVSGVPVERLYLVLLCLIALTVVVLMQVVGIIMVIALLTIPAAFSREFTNDLKKMMGISMIFGAVFCIVGIWLSMVFFVPSGATIILSMAVFYCLYLWYNHIK